MKYIHVKVAYAEPNEARQVKLTLPQGSTVRAAITKSGFIKVQSLEKLNALDVGIYGKKAPIDTLLTDGDRVEIYTPLGALGRDLKTKRKTTEHG